MNDSFWHKLFAFRFITLCGIVMAFFIFYSQTKAHPLSSFLFDPKMYIVASLIAVAVHIIWWVVVDKGTFYEFSKNLWRTLEDCVIINIVLLCTLSLLFWVTSFL